MAVKVISYGGGVQSTALVILAMVEDWHLDAIIHVDLLEAENPNTRRYVQKFNDWLQSEYGRKIDIVRSDLLGDMLAFPEFVPPPFIALDGSFMLKRQCTSQYKVRPFLRYLMSTWPDEQFEIALGISVDEWHRMRDAEQTYVTNVYPLVERLMTREDCKRVIKSVGLEVPEKSSCWFCPYRSTYQQDRIIAEYPHLEVVADELEERINAVRVLAGKQKIKVLKRSKEARQLELFCSGGWCDA